MLNIHIIRVNNGKPYKFRPKKLEHKFCRNEKELENNIHEYYKTLFIQKHYRKMSSKYISEIKEKITVDSSYTTIPDIEFIKYLTVEKKYTKIPTTLLKLLQKP